MNLLRKILLPLSALAVSIGAVAPADAYVSNFTSYSIQNSHGAAVSASGTAAPVVGVQVWATCSNTGGTRHYGPAKFRAFDPSQYVCPSPGTVTSYGYNFYY